MQMSKNVNNDVSMNPPIFSWKNRRFGVDDNCQKKCIKDLAYVVSCKTPCSGKQFLQPVCLLVHFHFIDWQYNKILGNI